MMLMLMVHRCWCWYWQWWWWKKKKTRKIWWISGHNEPSTHRPSFHAPFAHQGSVLQARCNTIPIPTSIPIPIPIPHINPQGPCCDRDCRFNVGNQCREDNGCRDESYCDGHGTGCPPSILKPNKTVCNEEFVCFQVSTSCFQCWLGAWKSRLQFYSFWL